MPREAAAGGQGGPERGRTGPTRPGARSSKLLSARSRTLLGPSSCFLFQQVCAEMFSASDRNDFPASSEPWVNLVGWSSCVEFTLQCQRFKTTMVFLTCCQNLAFGAAFLTCLDSVRHLLPASCFATGRAAFSVAGDLLRFTPTETRKLVPRGKPAFIF